MTTVAFDTLMLSRKLESAGFTQAHAFGAAEALSETIGDKVATKGGIRETEARVIGDLKERDARLSGEIRLIKWMLALVIVATVIPLIRDLL